LHAAVHRRQFFEVVDIGDRWRLDAERTHPLVGTPPGQFQTDPGQGVSIGRVVDANERPGFDAGQVHHPGRSHASVQRDLVDRLFGDIEVLRRIHMGPAMRVQMQRRGVPAVGFDAPGRLDGDASPVVIQRQGKINDS